MNPIIVIPARLASTRLPNKVMADINGKPMLQHCWELAKKSNIPVIIAAGDPEIQEFISLIGGTAILTNSKILTGSDRVHAALQEFDPNNHYDIVVNLQGDQPTLDPKHITEMLGTMAINSDIALCSLATLMSRKQAKNPNDVKAVLSIYAENRARCLYCSRNPVPHNGPFYHHIGVYAFQRSVLDRFVAAPRTPLEKIEDLEQLRILEMGLRMDVVIVDTFPLSVDTKKDLKEARKILR